MADRTVSVKLRADVDAYQGAILEAKATTEGLDREVKGLDKDVKELAPDMVKASAATELLGTQAGKAKTEAKGLGDETEKTKAKVVDLGSEITKTKAALADMGAEFQRTGKVNVDELGKLTRALGELERAKKDVEKLVPGGNGGGNNSSSSSGFLAKIGGGLSSGLNAVSGGFESTMTTALVYGAVAAAPAIGAAVNAGILLGIGGGGIAAGIVGAIQDPRVKSAWSDFGDFLKSGLADAASSFVGPMESAAIRVRAALSQVFTGMGHGLDVLAPSFTRLVDGLSQMVTRIDLGHAFASAAPIIDALAQELPYLGDAMNSFFSSIAAGGPGATAFFHDLMAFLDATIVTVGKLIGALSRVYGFFHDNPIGQFFTGPLANLVTHLEKTGDAGKNAGKNVHDGAEQGRSGLSDEALAAQQASISVNDLNTAIDNLVSKQLGAKNAHLQFNQSLLDLQKSVKQNGTDLRDNTDAGIANQQALLRMAQAAEADRQSVQQQTGSVDEANKVFDDHMTQIYGVAKALGLNKQQVDNLIGSIRDVPHDTQANIELRNAGKTDDDIREIDRGLSSLNGKTATTYVNVVYHDPGHTDAAGNFHRGPVGAERYGGIAYATGGVTSFAEAGIYHAMSGPGLVKFAEPETGGEAYIPRNIGDGRAMEIASVVGGWHNFDVVPRGGYRSAGGGSTTVINVNVNAGMVADGPALERQLGAVVRNYVRDNGGNVQVVLGRN